jgi:hypothetical protein
MGHLYHGYVDHNQRVFFFSSLFPFRQRQIEVEERQKRLLSEVAAERSEGDQRVQRLRQELRRMEQVGNGMDGERIYPLVMPK